MNIKQKFDGLRFQRMDCQIYVKFYMRETYSCVTYICTFFLVLNVNYTIKSTQVPDKESKIIVWVLYSLVWVQLIFIFMIPFLYISVTLERCVLVLSWNLSHLKFKIVRLSKTIKTENFNVKILVQVVGTTAKKVKIF